MEAVKPDNWFERAANRLLAQTSSRAGGTTAQIKLDR